MTDPRPISERQLQETVVTLLRFKAAPGVMFLAIPNGIPASARIGAAFKRQGMRAGAGDLLLIVDGRAHFLELKVVKGRQSPEQKAFELECGLCGIPYRLARSFSEAETILTEWGAFVKRETARRAA